MEGNPQIYLAYPLLLHQVHKDSHHDLKFKADLYYSLVPRLLAH